MRKMLVIAGSILLAISVFFLFILRAIFASRIEAARTADGQGPGFSYIGIVLLVFGIILVVAGFIMHPSKNEESFRMGY